ncbi:dna ligase [Phaffia rhodozyma]|uniref:Dna ligase n=1 Tax=Phaffia rhodozyma TaxID=264483 RepID=A0A0F7SE52_PHARH|nr:dna ligase [Phaffia rhodozyma]
MPKQKAKKPSNQPTVASFFGQPSNPTQSVPSVIDLVSSDEENDKDNKAHPLTSSLPSKRKLDEPTSPGPTSSPIKTIPGSNAYPDLDVDPLLFDPATAVDTSSWPDGRLTYCFIVQTAFVPIASTTKRLAIVRMLTNLLRVITLHDPRSLLHTVYLMSNHIGPSYEPNELGIGTQILTAALKSATGLSQPTLRRMSDKLGDAGDVAFEAKVNVRTLVEPKPLVVHKVYADILTLSSLKGTGVVKTKADIVQRLLVAAKGEEARFLVRTLVQNLRIGAVRVTLTTSLARAFTLTRPSFPDLDWKDLEETDYFLPPHRLLNLAPVPSAAASKSKGGSRKRARLNETEQLPSSIPSDGETVREVWRKKCEQAERLVRRVYVRHPNYSHIIPSLLSSPTGLENLSTSVPLTVGIPLSPMLGSITRSLGEACTRLTGLDFTSEAKLDGQRVQIHARVCRPDEQTAVRAEVGPGGWWGDLQPPDDQTSPPQTHRHPHPHLHTPDRLFVRLFSRHLEDMTEKYPDIITLVQILLTRPVGPRSELPEPPGQQQSDRIDQESFYPESVRSIVLDAEIVAVDKETGAFRTFQELTNRPKKDVKMKDIKVLVGVFAFDLMYLNKEILLNQPLRIRRHLLRTLLPTYTPSLSSSTLTASFGHVESIDSTDPADIQAFFAEAVAKKAEGIMIKLLDGVGVQGDDGFDEEDPRSAGKAARGDVEPEQEEEDVESEEEEQEQEQEEELKKEVEKAESQEVVPSLLAIVKKGGKKKDLPATYQPDVRSLGWLKVKKDYIDGGIGDSLDLVPIGAWHGIGRKVKWWSPVLLACYNPDSGMLEAVCKCMSGFSDTFYKAMKARYPEEGSADCWKADKSGRDVPGNVDTNGLIPDYWFAPKEVWEIKGADITLSPNYPAAQTFLGGERGLSIRFPRFIKIREDKTIENATSSQQFADMYRDQL